MLPTAPFELGSLVFRIQRAGENIFGALFFVAVAQAFVALIQYRTNPTGQLIVPPGLTIGTVEPTPTKISSTNITSTQRPESSPPIQDDSPSIQEPRQFFLSLNLDGDDEDNDGNQNKPKTISTEVSRYSRILNRLNKSLVLLLPWASQKLGWLLRRNTHLFHFGFIISLASLFDIPNRWFVSWQRERLLSGVPETPLSLLEEKDLASDRRTSSIDASGGTKKPIERIIVIGDSLAVGLGSCPIFDATKNNSVPFSRIENLNVDLTDESVPGPSFPRALAQTLADHYQTKVHWRSAGVDGGDVGRISEYCLDVIKEEADQGRIPDVVVIMCGINDLKYFVSNPFGAPGPRIFRQRLTQLLGKIKAVAPNTTIVLPMVPTQMFDTNSPLNIFPLNIFLDAVVGFWDSQKKLVAEQYPSDKVLYVGLPPGQVYDWYQNLQEERVKLKPDLKEDSTGNMAPTEEGLIAPDGVHPSAKCYALWAQFLGKRLVASCEESTAVPI